MDGDWWDKLVSRVLEKYATPFFLFSSEAILEQLDKVPSSNRITVENWLSLKTLPLKNLLMWWRTTGLGVEVTSEYELLAAQDAGFSGQSIIVNGVGKHSWNSQCWRNGLRVNFDSLEEIHRLADLAKRLQWHIGIRFHPAHQDNPDHPGESDQFGIPFEALASSIGQLKRNGLHLETMHFHLRSNIPNVDIVIKALNELVRALQLQDAKITLLDLGGGVPAERIVSSDYYWKSDYSIDGLSQVIDRAIDGVPSLQKVIVENGRFLLASSGVLVISVIDVKEIGGIRFLICDGGRTNHALPSDWEEHHVSVVPSRSGRLRQTAVCGPTCMAYDRLAILPLCDQIRIGDKIIWYDAGAYHLPWETRFSGPLASVIWHDKRRGLVEARKRESFHTWWGRGQ